MPANRPETVTFFFSDIEGSTRMLETLGPRYTDVLSRHREILRQAFAAHGGLEVGTEGDSFFAIFGTASDAVQAAVEAQRALGEEPWPAEGSVRVRIGLHSGEAVREGDDYVGLDVHRTARIMAASHGGQIVMSEAARAALGTLPDGVDVRDLGEHRLRDLSMRERLYQVLTDELDAPFPPLRTVDAIPNNLPAQATELIGRHAELASLRELIDTPAVRLITLTGPGGIGKTRLAVQAAADRIHVFEDGAYFVDLAAVRDVPAMFDAIVRATGVSVGAEAEPRDELMSQFQSRAALLVLDNFEQVIDAAIEVANLLARCPRIKVLITSREGLRLRGERLVPVEPLGLPASTKRLTAAEALRSDAVRLFVSRAEEAKAGFELTDADAEDIAEICARLDGLPLAIELAAASLRLFPPAELRQQLSVQLEPLSTGPRDLPSRQRTLRSAIEWSHDLLEPAERDLFAVLSVFSGARIDAVREVAANVGRMARGNTLSTLGALLDKSLLRSDTAVGGQRVVMLETIRHFASERLAESPELARDAAAAHAAYYAAVAAQPRDRQGADVAVGVESLRPELGNLEAAWRHFVGSAEAAHLDELVGGLWPLYEGRGWYHRAVGLANDLLEVLDRSTASPDRAEDEVALRLTLARGLLALRGYTPEVERLYREALDVSEILGATPRRLAVLRSLASFYLYQGQIDRTAAIGRQLLDLAAETHDSRIELEGYMLLGPATAFMGEVEAGLGHLQRVIQLFDPQRHGSLPFRLGPSPGVAAPAVSALMRWMWGQPDTAQELASQALEMAERLGHPYSLAYGHFHVGMLAFWNRDYRAAQRRAQRVLDVAREHDYRIWSALGMVMEGVTTTALGDPEGGLDRLRAGVDMYEGIQTPPIFWPDLLSLKADALAHAGLHAEALAVLDQAISLEGDGNWLSDSHYVQKAGILLNAGQPAAARAELRRASEHARETGARMLELLALIRLVAVADAAERGTAIARLRELLKAFETGATSPYVAEARRLVGARSAEPVTTRQ
jgi:predicted ATPase/class 3 adenylate cyclase